MNNTLKGETIPQTVENLQTIMAADAIRMENMSKEITKLIHQNQRLKNRLMKRK